MPSIRSNGRAGRRIKADINVVPYIDVMLVLLVIFMVTAPLITPGLINLPSVGQASDVPATPLEVQISEDGQLALRMREAGATLQDIPREQLIDQVRQRITAETPVVIAADGKVPLPPKNRPTLRHSKPESANALTRAALQHLCPRLSFDTTAPRRILLLRKTTARRWAWPSWRTCCCWSR